MLSVKEIVLLAEAKGWTFLLGKNEFSLIFRRYAEDGTRQKMVVYYTTRTVATTIKHPYKGRKQLHRRNVTDEELAILFENPRAHTGKGYYNKEIRHP